MAFLLYIIVVVLYGFIKIQPHWLLKLNAKIAGSVLYLYPYARKVTQANIKTAFPEKTPAQVREIARKSLINLAFNLTEFLWMCGRVKRIERYTVIPEPVLSQLKECVASNRRIIFVNPHLGSWECSGLMAPHYAGVEMVAIAKPVSNKYLDKFINKIGREQEKGLKIVYSKGAMRASIKALQAGQGVGTLIDQNTKLRDGGVFVDFFGLPVPSSAAPAVLMEYCMKNNIPAIIIYGTSVRLANGVITAHSEVLSKPFEEYESPKEVLQELMHISEEYIRRFPEHYLWFYKRFQHIPPDAPDAIKARFPFYAKVPSQRFFGKVVKK